MEKVVCLLNSEIKRQKTIGQKTKYLNQLIKRRYIDKHYKKFNWVDKLRIVLIV